MPSPVEVKPTSLELLGSCRRSVPPLSTFTAAVPLGCRTRPTSVAVAPGLMPRVWSSKVLKENDGTPMSSKPSISTVPAPPQVPPLQVWVEASWPLLSVSVPALASVPPV